MGGKKKKHPKAILSYAKNFARTVIAAQCTWQEKIAKFDMKIIIGTYIAIFIIGRFILHREPFRFGLVHQICLTTISLIVVYMLRYCYLMGNKLLEASSGLMGSKKKAKRNGLLQRSMYNHICAMKKYQKSVWCFVLPIIPCIHFIYKTLYLEYVPTSATGYFAVIFGAATFYLALIAYIHLVISIIFFGKIAYNSGECIPLQFPNDLLTAPQWLNLWVEYFSQAEKAFFITGMLFTLEYIILMPSRIITFEPNLIIHSKSPTAFLTSWLVIILLIIVGFPVIAFIIRKFFKKLLDNMKCLAKSEFSVLWDRKNSSNILSELWAYEQLSVNVMKMGTYIFQRKSYVPIVTTGISFVLNAVKLYESILVPLLPGIQN